MCNQVNGWTNYETWVINLWLTNDGDSDDLVETLITDPDDSDDTLYELSKRLQEYIEELNPLADESSMFSDMLSAAISSANYYEIAKNWMYDYLQNNPPKGTKINPEVYKVEPEIDPPGWWLFNSAGDDVDPYGEMPESFWDAFEFCIQNAIDNEYESIVIEWKITARDVERWNQYKTDRLIKTQQDRNTKIN